MRKILFALLLIGLNSSLFAQKEKRIPISIGYFSQSGYQPGLKLGTSFDLVKWESEIEKKNREFTKHKSLFISPQVGFYSRVNVQTSFLINADLGYKRVKSHKRKYIAWSIGLGYLRQSQITGWNISLSDGSKEKIRDNWDWLLTSINYEFGQAISSNLEWYSKFSYGLKLSTERDRTSLLFLELGLKMYLF